MQPPSTPASVSNLVASWDDPERPEATATHGSDERVEPAIAATVVDHAVRRRLTTGRARLVTPPGTFELEQRGPSVDATVVPERSGTGTIELPELPAPTFPSAYELLTEHDVPAAAAPAVEALADAIEEHRPVRELGDRVAAPRELPRAPYDELQRRDIARELLRARLVAIAEQREHRSAYEVAFIFLAAALSVLLAAPPLVRVLLAAHGIEA